MAGAQALRIGITIGLHREAETLWNNGIKQNAVFLAEALKNCHNVASVVLVNTTATPVTPALPWDQALADAQLRAGQGQRGRDDRGGRPDRCGPDGLPQAARRATGVRTVPRACDGVRYLFSRPLWGQNLFVNQRYDDIWMVRRWTTSAGSRISRC